MPIRILPWLVRVGITGFGNGFRLSWISQPPTLRIQKTDVVPETIRFSPRVLGRNKFLKGVI
jgi:hypothetical protein